MTPTGLSSHHENNRKRLRLLCNIKNAGFLCFLRNYNRDTSKVMALGFMRPEDALGAWWGPGEDADRRFCRGPFWDIGFYSVGLCFQLTCWEVVGTKEANLSEKAVTLELVTAWGSQ